MTIYAKRKLKYSRNENFNLLHYVEWDRFATLAGSKSGLRVTLSYLYRDSDQSTVQSTDFTCLMKGSDDNNLIMIFTGFFTSGSVILLRC